MLNDFSEDSEIPSINFWRLANVRFDVRGGAQEILLHSDAQSWNSSIYSNLPDKEQGFKKDEDGSDVLDVLEKLLHTPKTCGARVILLLKRFPSGTDNTLLHDLQRNHIFIQTAGSSTPLGATWNFNVMYQLSTLSHGIYVSAEDGRIAEIAANQLTAIYDMSLIYQAQTIGGKTDTELQPISIPDNIEDPLRFNAFIMVNVRNNVTPDDFIAFTLRLMDTTKTTTFQTFSVPETDSLEDGSTVFSTLFDLPSNVTSCRVVVDSEYSGGHLDLMDIRVYTRASTNFSIIATCSPDAPFIILFAYSNDFDSDIIENTINLFQLYTTEMDRPNFSKLANIRFDTRKADEIKYWDDFDDLYSDVMAKLPDPSLGFNDSATGSDVVEVIQKLLDNKAAPVCGARVILLLKRLSNSNDVANLLGDLKARHVTIQTTASRNITGGRYLETVYKLSAESQGVYIYVDDIVVPAYSSTILSSSFEMSPIYATNPSFPGGVGKMELAQKVPVLHNLVDTYYGQNAYLMINVVDSGDLSLFNSLKFSLIDSNDLLVYNVTIPDRQALAKETLFATGLELPSTPSVGGYRVFLDYDYSPDVVRNSLEIRIYTYTHQSFWPPFDQ